jgi:hypothetical protein
MNAGFFDRMELIKSLLRQGGYGYVADDLLEQQLSGGTGGEVLMLVCARLLGIKQTDPEAYAVVAYEADELIAYCRQTGMFPKASFPESN